MTPIQQLRHVQRLSMDLYKAAKELDAARAEADGLRALIEAQAELVRMTCYRKSGGCDPDGYCSCKEQGYIIELPERAKG